MTATPSSESHSPGDVFATTHWTVVLAAGRRHTPQSDHALEELCRTYWFPLYAYVRRQGHSKEDAEDLTQAFFARFLAKNVKYAVLLIVITAAVVTPTGDPMTLMVFSVPMLGLYAVSILIAWVVGPKRLRKGSAELS